MSKLLERLRDPMRSGVYRVTGGEAVEQVLGGANFDTAQVGLEGGDALRAIARALQFPDWFGNNWDALEDCLGDLSWRGGEGHVLLLRGWQQLPSDDLGVLIDVLGASAEFWSGRGRPFFALLVDPDRKLALPPLYRDA
jgi:hypothetical protein